MSDFKKYVSKKLGLSFLIYLMAGRSGMVAYCKHTSYDTCSELKKLNFIINNIKKFSKLKTYETEILEIGCGNGAISLALASLGYNIIGIDINQKKILDLNNDNSFPNAKFHIGDAENVKINQKFDIIICSEVFEHLRNPSKLTKTLRSLIKSNGILIITIPNGFGPWELLFDIPARFIMRIYRTIMNKNFEKGQAHIQNFTLKSFSNLLSNYGLNIRVIQHSDFVSGFPILRKSRFAFYDTNIADRLPHILVSGWYFICDAEPN